MRPLSHQQDCACASFLHRADQHMLAHKELLYFSFDSVPMHKNQERDKCIDTEQVHCRCWDALTSQSAKQSKIY